MLNLSDADVKRIIDRLKLFYQELFKINFEQRV